MNRRFVSLVGSFLLLSVAACAAPLEEEEETGESSNAISAQRAARPGIDGCRKSGFPAPFLGVLQPGEARTVNVPVTTYGTSRSADATMIVRDTHNIGHPVISVSATAFVHITYRCREGDGTLTRPAAVSCRGGAPDADNDGCIIRNGTVVMAVDCPGMGAGNDTGDLTIRADVGGTSCSLPMRIAVE
jgi:hypothetical protein